MLQWRHFIHDKKARTLSQSAGMLSSNTCGGADWQNSDRDQCEKAWEAVAESQISSVARMKSWPFGFLEVTCVGQKVITQQIHIPEKSTYIRHLWVVGWSTLACISSNFWTDHILIKHHLILKTFSISTLNISILHCLARRLHNGGERSCVH
jgi:hypothetical protein